MLLSARKDVAMVYVLVQTNATARPVDTVEKLVKLHFALLVIV
jgi:hypothetical protein